MKRYTRNGKQRRELRAASHGQKAVLQVGRGGLDPAVIDSAGQALAARELIKVAVGKSCPRETREVAEELALALSAEVVETKGRTFLLYRPDDES